nr:alpha ketoglutarate dependent [Hymenolepis microstoma]CUU98675.1 alpha ketoglutarate dependent [Hymenolepis microstoma]
MELSCACKGIRFCKESSNFLYLTYCNKCSRSYLLDGPRKKQCENHCNGFILDGVVVLDNFITEEEENDLLNKIGESVWVESQSGRRKQDYGVKVNFKKKSIKFKHFTGLPNYSRYLVERLHKQMRTDGKIFKDFFPVELCNLEYLPERGAAIVPHLDDSWLWGERLVLLNLASETKMTFTLPFESPGYDDEWVEYKKFAQENFDFTKASLPPSIAVPLHRRALLIMSGKARFVWYHAINREDITARRLSLTMRELSDEYLPPYSMLRHYAVCPEDTANTNNDKIETSKITDNQKLGLELIKVAFSFSGITVGDTVRMTAKTPNCINAK